MIPKPGHYRASTHSIGDPRDIEKLADILVNAERPAILYGQQVWTARGHEEAIALLRGLDIPGYFNGGAAACCRRAIRIISIARAAMLSRSADVIVIVGTPFDFRMGYGKRISNELQAGADRHGLPHGRQEPRHRPGSGRAIRARSWARCCRPPPAASSRTSARRASSG